MVKKPDKLKFWEKIKCWAHGRKFVGFDHIGNKYFEQLGAHVGMDSVELIKLLARI